MALASDLELEAAPLARRSYSVCKRCLDVVIASLLLLALCWLLILIALAVRISSDGPVVFRQVRIGRNGQPFEMLKFRTMRPDRRRHGYGPPPGIPERRLRHKSACDPA